MGYFVVGVIVNLLLWPAFWVVFSFASISFGVALLFAALATWIGVVVIYLRDSGGPGVSI
jgi:hypothetical protein